MRRTCLGRSFPSSALVGRLVTAQLLLTAAGLLLPAAAARAAVVARTPVYRLGEYRKVGQDRSFKCDLAAELRTPPEIVVFGGSRATRFQPSVFHEVTGLTALNAATRNFRPEDAWAISSFLYRRAPDVRLRAFFAVQSTTFSDARLHPGLLYDRRLSRWFPVSLVSRMKRLVGTPHRPNLLRNKRFSSRGLLLWNGYDQRRADGVPLEDILADYLEDTLPKAGDTAEVRQTRSHLYFEKTIKLFNQHGVVPVVVIMPYHPTVLEAYRAVGWEVKVDRLRAYLADLQNRCDLRVVDLLEIGSFGGSPDEFYDGSHITMENSARIIGHVVTVAPECFQ